MAAGFMNAVEIGEKGLLFQFLRLFPNHFAIAENRVEGGAKLVTHIG